MTPCMRLNAGSKVRSFDGYVKRMLAPKFEVSMGMLKEITFRSLAFKGFRDGYSTGACVCLCECPLTQKPRTYDVAFANDAWRTPPTSPPCRWPTLITLRALTMFELVWCRLCDDVCPPSSSAPSVLPEDRIGRNIRCIRRFCDHIDVLHIFDQTCIVSTLGWRSTTCLLYTSPSPRDLSTSRMPSSA